LQPAPHGLSIAWPLALIAAVLYGSLIPFEVDWAQFQRSGGFGLFHLTSRITTMEDVITNVLVYVPIGLALVLCGAQRGMARFFRVPVAVMVGAAVSVFAETLQIGIAARVPSWVDVALNTLGTAVGALLGAGLYGSAVYAFRRLREAFGRRPFRTSASLLTIGLFAYHLAPFDFITNSAELHESFRNSRWDFALSRSTVLGAPSSAHLMGELAGAAWFAALGYLLVLAARRSGRGALHALGSAAKHGLILAGLIEVMQLFTMSHQFEPAVFALRSVAATAGAWCALLAVNGTSRSSWIRQPWLAVPTRLLIAAAVFQVIAIMVSSAKGGHGHASVDHATNVFAGFFGSANVHWIPFEALWQRPAVNALSDILATVATYGALSLTIALALRRARISAVWPAAGVAVLSVAIVAEAVQAGVATRTADVTGPALALFAVIAVSRCYFELWSRRLSGIMRPFPQRAAEEPAVEPHRRGAQDLLTGKAARPIGG
jgi:VanZ family protein